MLQQQHRPLVSGMVVMGVISLNAMALWLLSPAGSSSPPPPPDLLEGLEDRGAAQDSALASMAAMQRELEGELRELKRQLNTTVDSSKLRPEDQLACTRGGAALITRSPGTIAYRSYREGETVSCTWFVRCPPTASFTLLGGFLQPEMKLTDTNNKSLTSLTLSTSATQALARFQPESPPFPYQVFQDQKVMQIVFQVGKNTSGGPGFELFYDCKVNPSGGSSIASPPHSTTQLFPTIAPIENYPPSTTVAPTTAPFVETTTATTTPSPTTGPTTGPNVESFSTNTITTTTTIAPAPPTDPPPPTPRVPEGIMVIVDSRITRELGSVIARFANAEQSWDVMLVHGRRNFHLAEEIRDKVPHLQLWQLDAVDLIRGSHGGTEYSRLLANNSFWSRLPNHEYILIFQTDTGVCDPRISGKALASFKRREVAMLCAGLSDGGCGGLSLRRRSWMLKATEENYFFQVRSNLTLGEDETFCSRLTSLGAPLGDHTARDAFATEGTSDTRQSEDRPEVEAKPWGCQGLGCSQYRQCGWEEP